VANSSAATAVVTGVVALVRSRYPGWTNVQVRNRILTTAGLNCWRSTPFGPIVNAEAAVGGLCVPTGKPIGPETIQFDHQAAGDTRTTQSASYCVYPSGGSGSIQITWADGSHGNCRTVNFARGSYFTTVWVDVKDTGVANPALRATVSVQVSDLDIDCPTCW
jgi:hypothetical protein